MAEKSKLGSILVQSSMISPEDVQRALEEQRRSNVRFGEALINLGIVEEEDVGWGLANQLNVPFIRLTSDTFDPDAVRRVPEPLARRHNLVPFLKIDDELTVVIEDPLNKKAIAEVEAVSECKVNVCIGLPEEITEKINQVYGTIAGPQDDISELDSDIFTPEDLEKIAADFSGDTFLRTLLNHTVSACATSVHFEPKNGKVNLRFRTEQGINQMGTISQGWFLVLVNRLKSLLDLSETQNNFIEGFLSHNIDDRRYMFYTSIVSSQSGNSVTLINLTPKDFPDDFDDLPITEDERESILRIIGGRHGLSMIVGPGKLEKLSFIDLILKKKHADVKKAFVIGSMPWFVDSGYIRLKVHVEDSQNILDGLKVAITQDPDILYVEDVWDRKVLQFALQAAISNTYVISTLHFPDTLLALEYANENIENKTLLSQSLRGLIGVHVFRLLCPECKQLDTDYAVQSRTLKMPRSEVEKNKIYRASSCDHCNGHGYSGSKILIECLEIDQEMREFLKAGHKFSVVKDKIIKKGHRTIEQQATQLVLTGSIGIDDFKSVEKR